MYRFSEKVITFAQKKLTLRDKVITFAQKKLTLRDLCTTHAPNNQFSKLVIRSSKLFKNPEKTFRKHEILAWSNERTLLWNELWLCQRHSTPWRKDWLVKKK